MPVTLESETRADGWLWRPSLARRIGFAMVLSLMAIQAQAFLQIKLFSKPQLNFTGTRWLAEATREAVQEAFAVPPAKRSDLLRAKSDSILKYSWLPNLQSTDDNQSMNPLAARMTATLQDLLGESVKGYHITVDKLGYRFPDNVVTLDVIPPDIASMIGNQPVRRGDPEIPIHAGIRISVQGHDGSWVSVKPVGFEDGTFANTLPWAPLLAGGLMIAAVSTLLARRMVAPLDRLVKAAGRVGTSREPVKVETEGLYEFTAVARAFEDMQRRLLRFVDDRTQMLAAISHDLRSSLTRMRFAIDDIADAHQTAAIMSEIADMQSMLDSTLAFASGEARALPSQLTDIAALLISIVDEASDKGHPCIYEGPDHVETMGHPVSLKRAFRNLIDNGVKYGGSVQVALAVKPDMLTISIIDDGPGIPISRIEEAFAPFRRLDTARGAKIPGAGLGLTIARDVIQSHGGTISVGNKIERGLRVLIELPKL